MRSPGTGIRDGYEPGYGTWQGILFADEWITVNSIFKLSEDSSVRYYTESNLMEDTYASCDSYSKLKSMPYLSDSVFLMTRQNRLFIEMIKQMFQSMIGSHYFLPVYIRTHVCSSFHLPDLALLLVSVPSITHSFSAPVSFASCISIAACVWSCVWPLRLPFALNGHYHQGIPASTDFCYDRPPCWLWVCFFSRL